MINILTQKAAALYCLSIPIPVFRMSDIQIIYGTLIKKTILYLNLVHYLFSFAIYKFKSADYVGAIIVCQGNFIIC